MFSRAHRGGCLWQCRRQVPVGRSRSRTGGRRGGVACVLAMLYLVVFTALALGFFAQAVMNTQVSGNEQRVMGARLAAESGLRFVQYQLSRVKIDPSVTPAGTLEAVQKQLAANLNGTGNLGTRTVDYVGGAIELPGGAEEYVTLGPDGLRFRAIITQGAGGALSVEVNGRAGRVSPIGRAIHFDFNPADVHSPVFDYGVATNGAVALSEGFIKGDPAALGSILSTSPDASPVTLSGGTASIDGKVYLTNPTGTVSGDGSVGGVSDPTLRSANVVPNTKAPEFPVADPTPFITYMQGKETLVTGNTGDTYLSNIRIKAGTNPTLGNSPTIEGVILIEAPNQVTFSGTSGTVIRGVIVVVNPTEATSTNSISFTGGVSIYGPQTLPDCFGELKTLTGTAILAPNFTVTTSGTSSSMGGSILAKALTLSDASGGTVAGTVILTGNSTLTVPQNSTLTMTAPCSTATPAGMVVTHTYAPQFKSYTEVSP